MFLLYLQYRGTDLHGFQKQKNLRTVEGELEIAARYLTGDLKPAVRGCARTDAGAHAICHPVAINIPEKFTVKEVIGALNSRLPEDIRVLHARKVGKDFVPLKEAVARTYVYILLADRFNEVFLRDFSFCPKNTHDIDWDLFESALKMFIGEHDFSAFSKKDTDVRSRLRTIHEIEVFKERNMYAVRLTANGFLYGMIRSIIGAALEVAYGRSSFEKIEKSLASGRQHLKYSLVPASGLYLYQVWFKNKELNFEPVFPFINIDLPDLKI